MDVSPHKALPVDYADLRHRTMNENGIHIIYPMGRNYPVSHPGSFNMYEGFTLRVIGYVIDPTKTYEHVVHGNNGEYILIKWDSRKPSCHVQARKGGVLITHTNETFYYGDYYSFAIRGAHDSTYGQSYQAYAFDYKFNAVAFDWYAAHHSEGIYHPSVVHLSKHYYDWPPSDFPTLTGLDPYLSHFVQMEVGTVAHYSGIYTGPNEIAVVAPGGVRDLGRPKHSGTVIRIAIRKTLNNYTFFADYATEPVIGKYQDLVVSGHEYTPRFSMNFNIRHVYMEVYS